MRQTIQRLRDAGAHSELVYNWLEEMIFTSLPNCEFMTLHLCFEQGIKVLENCLKKNNEM